MKCSVLDDGRLAGLELPPLGVQDALQIGKIFVRHARGRGARDGRLEHSADIQKFVLQILSVGHHRGQGRDQAIHRQFLRKRALPVPSLEQADRFQHAKRVADRAAAHAEPLGQEALRRAVAGPAGTCRPRISMRIRSATSSATRVFLIGWIRLSLAAGGEKRLDTLGHGC